MLRGCEGVRCVSDGQMVVFGIGGAYTEFGCAGEVSPRGVIRAEVGCSESERVRKVIDCRDAEDLYQLLVDFLHLLFFKYVVMGPKGAGMLLLESPLAVTSFGDALAKVVFKRFEVGSMLFLPGHLAVVGALGINTALVLDVGCRGAALVPVFGGVPMLGAWQALSLGGQIIHENLEKYFQDAAGGLDLSERMLEDVRVGACFVTALEGSARLGTEIAPVSPPDVVYPGVRGVLIPGEIGEGAFGVLWERDGDGLSLPTMMLDAIIKCPLDARRVLAEGVILVGGTTMAGGFAGRLGSELLALIEGDLCRAGLRVELFGFHAAPSRPSCTAWLGGAIFGAADLPLRCLSGGVCLGTGRVPDWSNLIDGRRDEASCEV